MIEKLKNLGKRNLILLSIFFLSMFIPAPAWSIATQTIFIIIGFEMVALMLSNIAHFCYTELNFISAEKFNDRPILGWIFLGVHLLVGLSVYSIYMLEGLQKTIMP